MRRVPSEHPQPEAAEHDDGQRHREVVGDAAGDHHAAQNQQRDGVREEVCERAVYQGRAENAGQALDAARHESQCVDETLVHEQAVQGHRPDEGQGPEQDGGTGLPGGQIDHEARFLYSIMLETGASSKWSGQAGLPRGRLADLGAARGSATDCQARFTARGVVLQSTGHRASRFT